MLLCAITRQFGLYSSRCSDTALPHHPMGKSCFGMARSTAVLDNTVLKVTIWRKPIGMHSCNPYDPEAEHQRLLASANLALRCKVCRLVESVKLRLQFVWSRSTRALLPFVLNGRF